MKGIRAQNVNFTFFLWGTLPFVNNVWNTIFVIHGCTTWIRQYFCSSSVHWYITQTINQKAMHIVRRIIIWLSPMQQYQIWTCDITMLKMHFFLTKSFRKQFVTWSLKFQDGQMLKWRWAFFCFVFMFNLSSHIGQKSSCFSHWSVNPCWSGLNKPECLLGLLCCCWFFYLVHLTFDWLSIVFFLAGVFFFLNFCRQHFRLG